MITGERQVFPGAAAPQARTAGRAFQITQDLPRGLLPHAPQVARDEATRKAHEDGIRQEPGAAFGKEDAGGKLKK